MPNPTNEIWPNSQMRPDLRELQAALLVVTMLKFNLRRLQFRRAALPALTRGLERGPILSTPQGSDPPGLNKPALSPDQRSEAA